MLARVTAPQAALGQEIQGNLEVVLAGESFRHHNRLQ